MEPLYFREGGEDAAFWFLHNLKSWVNDKILASESVRRPWEEKYWGSKPRSLLSKAGLAVMWSCCEIADFEIGETRNDFMRHWPIILWNLWATTLGLRSNSQIWLFEFPIDFCIASTKYPKFGCTSRPTWAMNLIFQTLGTIESQELHLMQIKIQWG